MSKPKDQGNCAVKQKQAKKKICQRKDLLARSKKKKKFLESWRRRLKAKNA